MSEESDSGGTVLPLFYNDDYLHFSKAMTSPERTENEVEFICQVLELKPGSRVLDLGCGFGRISNRLAARGCRVTGVDAVPLLLEHARKKATATGVHVTYQLSEARCFSDSEKFDAVLLWFYSFGYYDDIGNAQVLASARRALMPGGQLLFDQYNITALAPAAMSDSYTVIDLGDSLLLQRPIADLERGRWGAERIAVRNGKISRSRFTCRCYSPPELTALLTHAGFSGIQFFGDGFTPLSIASNRMIVMAQVPAEP